MRNFVLAAATGALSAFAFEPVGLWLGMPAAFAVLIWLLWQTERPGHALLIGWLFGFGQFVVGLNWIATAFTFQSNMPAWLGWVAVVLLSLYLAIYPAVAAGLAWRTGRRNETALVLALAGAWVITEWLRAIAFTGFPWNPAGAALVPSPFLSISALVGTYGMSAIAVLIGGVVWLEFHRRWLPGAIIVAALLLLWLVPKSLVPDHPLTIKQVRIVQPNIGQQDKWRPGFADEAARRLQAASAPGGPRPRLLFWPEAAVTDPLHDERSGPPAESARFERARAAASIGEGEYLLTGGLGIRSSDGKSLTGATNSIFVLDPGGKIIGRYDKAHLVPYGEYLPMRPLLSTFGLSRLAPGDVDFDFGPGPRTIDLPGWGQAGMQICYEIVFSGNVVDPDHRPDFIFNPSNDAWFGSWGPPQHLAQARLRAAEEGLPVIRATPTGISALIDARGQIVDQTGWREAGVINAVLPPPAEVPTAFARFGNAIPLLLAALLLIGAIALAGGWRYRRT
ncbi:MAG TPA: apolipoprotein N-acyltransferase [Sphingomicrobium sp.]|nr:apolipoprotein N-acyltransferase [Sphingomicrobium sp.]